ncbi:hypothetical protein GCM10025331_50830 [Actinoplanes utahensis]|nr:hypothetical protein Aut01nite_65110 [Actinoplanes utahensis]
MPGGHEGAYLLIPEALRQRPAVHEHHRAPGADVLEVQLHGRAVVRADHEPRHGSSLQQSSPTMLRPATGPAIGQMTAPVPFHRDPDRTTKEEDR